MTKKLFYFFLVVLITSLFLSACSKKEDDLTDKWNDMAKNEGFYFYSNDGVEIRFTPEGMFANIDQQDFEEDKEKPFPFDERKYYPNYEIEKNDGKIIIKTEDNLKYFLKIKGDRVYLDEENNVEYKTEKYLLDEK